LNAISGIKFVLKGKISGKPRSSVKKISIGSIPIQSAGANIHFSKSHVYTFYGAYGFRLWLHLN